VQGLLGVPGVAVCGSVSTAVFSLAHSLGCNPIVFLGQDLAYTGGRTHAGGSFWDESRARVSAETGQLELSWSETLKKVGHRNTSEPVVELPAWGGEGTVVSGPTFTGIRTWLEAAAATLAQQQPELRLVNATEGGARLQGFEERTLRELLDGLPEVSITARDLAACAAARRPGLTREEVARWAAHQADLADGVRRAARRVRRVAEHARAALRDERSSSVWKAFAALDAAEESMSAAVRAAPLVDLFAHDPIHEAAHAHDTSSAGESAHADALRSTERGVAVARVVEHEATDLAARFRDAARSLRP
jgi:hypothetical protein